MSKPTRINLHPPQVIDDRSKWPPDYTMVYAWRQQQIIAMRSNPIIAAGAREYYRTRPVEFICHWVDTYDPRNAGQGKLARMPMVLFRRQADLVEFFDAMIRSEESGLVEKCRDMGATWVAVAYSIHLFLFREGAAVGWGSRKEDLVDKIGNPDSIFEKIRMAIRGLPQEFLPDGFSPKDHMTFMKVINPENGATITGEGGDNIGRGGRKLIYFKDEAAHYERPELIEAALADNTRTQIDISSVNGLGNVFHRRRSGGTDWTGGAAIPGTVNVLVMDWTDHPGKSREWYDARKKKAESDGLLHVFMQEIERNYSASVVGTIIPYEWIESSIDAHITLGIDVGQKRFAGLDVADDGPGDTNALAIRRDILLESIEEWGGLDTGETTRRTVEACAGEPIEIEYDCIGIGAGVKSEANRLEDEGLLPHGQKFIAWSASHAPLNPDGHVIDDDEQSPLNKDFFFSIKPQGWWALRTRFEKTHRRIHEGVICRDDEIISISSAIPKQIRMKLMKELAQVTKKQTTGTLKMVVNKAPQGTASPNMGDATMMAFFPIPDNAYTLENL